MKRKLLAGMLLAFALGAGSAFATVIKGGASTFVNNLADQAIKVLAQKDTPLVVREAKFQKILTTHFDVPIIARFALGRYWRQASTEQKKDYVDLFGRYVAKSYVTKLGGYTGEKFNVLSERPLSNKKDVLVNTRIVRPSGPPVNVAWRVRSRKDNKLIVDVMVEGISMALTQRNEFSSVVQRYGLPGLLESLRARTTKVSATK